MDVISPIMESKRHELVSCAIEHIERELVDCCGIDPEKSASIAVRVVDKMVDLFGGQNITWPKEYQRKLIQRDAEIYAAFNGTNLSELGIKYKISDRGLRKLLARVRARKSQGRAP